MIRATNAVDLATALHLGNLAAIVGRQGALPYGSPDRERCNERRQRMKSGASRSFALRRVFFVAAAALAFSGPALAQKRTFSFAYDQPPTTAYGIAANIFDTKLKELSGGTLSINQFPG